ncbi:uncharacterized protein LOC112538493 [Tetranychus urticae]|uniref:uncharacterized protein LOC112538493 n=1 Tax=Tetranychus urticae TaxID=32264 RepID=UPI000D653381|nr:uncharacterized protein LOC112538493 [Tetranychus urticae]XP_025016445.1 uncharacterized protein LOC112538493 [Tetranychus urticae]
MKKSDRFILLPRAANATRVYAAIKIILCFLFMAYFVSLVAWTVHAMAFFKSKIDEDNDVTRENQKYKTHNHFFLFTGLYIGAATLIGLWGILKENISTIFGFLCLFAIGFVFEITGAFKSNDEDVRKLKFVSVSLEPVLMVLSLGFTLMIRSAEKRLASLPIYRQTMAESRRNSLTGSEIGASPTMEIANQQESGHDNPNLDLQDEPNAQQQSSNNNNNNNDSRGVATLPVKQESFLKPPS